VTPITRDIGIPDFYVFLLREEPKRLGSIECGVENCLVVEAGSLRRVFYEDVEVRGVWIK
jgi:hypothetical protein